MKPWNPEKSFCYCRWFHSNLNSKCWNAKHPPLPVNGRILSIQLRQVPSWTPCVLLWVSVWNRPLGSKHRWNRSAFQLPGCGETPEVRARLRPLLLRLTLWAPPLHKAAIFPLLFFPPGSIFLELRAEYCAQFVCVCVWSRICIYEAPCLPPPPELNPRLTSERAGKVNKLGKKKQHLGRAGTHPAQRAGSSVADSPQDVAQDSDNDSYFHQSHFLWNPPPRGW